MSLMVTKRFTNFQISDLLVASRSHTLTQPSPAQPQPGRRRHRCSFSSAGGGSRRGSGQRLAHTGAVREPQQPRGLARTCSVAQWCPSFLFWGTGSGPLKLNQQKRVPCFPHGHWASECVFVAGSSLLEFWSSVLDFSHSLALVAIFVANKKSMSLLFGCCGGWPFHPFPISRRS